MADRDFLSRHGIVRHAIREDVFFFLIPFFLVFAAGLVLSARDGWNGVVKTVWNLVRQPESLRSLSGVNIVGLALVVIGLALAFVGAGTLRRFYASTLVIREDHQLITHGVFRFVRHPIYLGVLMICIGVPVYASSLYGLLTMSILIPLFLTRIRMEEQLLTEEFGAAYQSYRESTSKLIPFIY